MTEPLLAETRYDVAVRMLTDKISRDYKTPLTEERIRRMTKKTVMDVCNAALVTGNSLSICKTESIVSALANSRDSTTVMTYSFPCQSLSLAGKLDGMEKGSGTQSSLLWEVGRLPRDAHENGVLPDILLMENVPEVVGERNIGVFRRWLELLHSLGYRSKWQILNAKDYKVPQNRRRCFMVSWRSDDYYDFPDPMPLEHRLKDLLEKDVPERYYVSEKKLSYVMSPKRFGKHTRITDGDCIAMTRTADAGNNWTGDFISEFPVAYDTYNRKMRTGGITGTVQTRNIPKHQDFIVEAPKQVRRLTELECFRLQGVKQDDFERLKVRQSSSSLYHMAGDSIETSVEKIIFKGKGCYIKLKCNAMYETSCQSIGKTVFFTRESAEKALAEKDKQ